MPGGTHSSEAHARSAYWVDRAREIGKRWGGLAGYQLRRAVHTCPSTYGGEHERILADLEHEGATTSTLERLDLRATSAFRFDAERAVEELKSLSKDSAPPMEYPSGFEHCIPMNPSRIADQYPGIYLWGLDHGILSLVENVIGTGIIYHGVILRRELLDGRIAGTRYWHVDHEDHDITRITVYLTDVNSPEDGAFEFIPRLLSPAYQDFPDDVDFEKIDDQVMATVVPRWQWRSCCGPAETVVFKVPSRIFHHGRNPETERIAASFYYTSDRPVSFELARRYSFQSGLSHLNARLSARQIQCLGEYAHELPR